jgi:hypothetical protein
MAINITNFYFNVYNDVYIYFSDHRSSSEVDIGVSAVRDCSARRCVIVVRGGAQLWGTEMRDCDARRYRKMSHGVNGQASAPDRGNGASGSLPGITLCQSDECCMK